MCVCLVACIPCSELTDCLPFVALLITLLTTEAEAGTSAMPFQYGCMFCGYLFKCHVSLPDKSLLH